MIEQKITHPGVKIREAIEELRQITGKPFPVEEIAEKIGAEPDRFLAVVNCEENLTPELAIRLGAAFPYTSAQHWMAMQCFYDIEVAEPNVDVSKIEPLRPTAYPDLRFF